MGQINLKSTETSLYGLWQSEICVNSYTDDFHNENDATYTLITVPNHKPTISTKL